MMKDPQLAQLGRVGQAQLLIFYMTSESSVAAKLEQQGFSEGYLSLLSAPSPRPD